MVPSYAAQVLYLDIFILNIGLHGAKVTRGAMNSRGSAASVQRQPEVSYWASSDARVAGARLRANQTPTHVED